MNKSLEKKLTKKAGSLAGIKQVKIIPADTIITAEWVRRKCRYGCGGYGQCLTCPPHSPAPAETAAMLRGYEKALLLHGHDCRKLRRAALALEREAFLGGLPAAFAMSAGPCDLCAECPVDEGCRHPEKARPSLEACGVDVFSTVKNNGLHIRVLTSTDQTPDYYAAVLLE